MNETYMGIPLVKFPEDLMSYVHLLWKAMPNTVIELGCHAGGGALWFRDQLLLLRHYGLVQSIRVISIDITTERAKQELQKLDPGYTETITLVEGSVLDPDLSKRIEKMLTPDSIPFIVEDSAHVYDTTLASLNGFSRFVRPGGFFVVEDTNVDIENMRMPDWPRGAGLATKDWLAQHPEFETWTEFERYGITCHPGSTLRRKI